MINVIYAKETDSFLTKGTINLGILGSFENKEYGENNFEIENTLQEFLEIVDTGEYVSLLGDLYPLLKECSRNGEEVAIVLQEYYNRKLQNLNNNIKQFNDCIWAQLFSHLIGTDWAFWENEETIAPKYRGKDWEEEVMHIYKDKKKEIYAVLKEYTNGSPNNGTIQKVDVEKKMREYFYMFNFDGLIENINSYYCGLYFSLIEFEFEDNWNQELFCSATGTLNEDFSLRKWDNF